MIFIAPTDSDWEGNSCRTTQVAPFELAGPPELFRMTDKWQLRQQPGDLGSGEVHLWVASLRRERGVLSTFEATLSQDEKERAHRFKKVEDADRYVAARGLLRNLLGTYLALSPGQIQFEYNALGKPHLVTKEGVHSLNFSVSHSDELGLFGFARQYRIGVDLECNRSEFDFDDLVERYFSLAEVERLRSLPADQQKEAFYRGWTRKEAYLKARGDGLSYPLEKVEVTLTPDEPALLLGVADDPDASHHWVLQHLSPAMDYIGAVAVETDRVSFTYGTWEPA